MDGILALDLWDVVIEVLHAGNCVRDNVHNIRLKKEGVDQLSNLGHVTTNAHDSQGTAQLHIFEDNEAVIKMNIKGRSPMMRHGVALDWLFARINLDPKIQIKYVDTKNQLADMLTKRSFTRDEWRNLLCLVNFMDLSMFYRIHFRSVEMATTCRREFKKRME